MILIFCAPSGSGKSTFVNYLLTHYGDFELSVSATSRSPRGKERNGVEYYFLTPEEFTQKIDNNEFVEYEQVYAGLYYGTLKSEIERIEANNHHVIFDVDVKGGVNLKRKFGDDALSVFIQPPSVAALRERLKGRGTDSEEMIEKRIAKSEYELTFANQFDEIIVNDDLDTALKELIDLLQTKHIIQ